MSFRKLVDEAMKHGDAVIAEKSPPGFKGTVKAMKDHDDVSNPYALAWWMKNKGYQSHKKADGTAKECACETIRVSHPVYGTGTVEAITESHIDITWDNLDKRMSVGNLLAFEDAKYLTREEYTSNPEDAQVQGTRPKKMKAKAKAKVQESMVAVGMTAVQGTHRDNGTETIVTADDDILRFDDLLSEDDDWQKPWEDESDDTDDSRSEEMDGDTHSLRDAEDTRDYEGSDFVNVPRPSDSVLTNQEDQPEYHADPLATMDGFDAAGEGDEPDGDFNDLNPVDAPDIPQVRDLDGSADRHNTRDAGDDSDDTSEVQGAGDYDESKPEDNGGEEKMKKTDESAWLTAEDLGLELTEMEQGTGYAEMDGDYMEHDMGSGEIALTCEFAEKLLKACAVQSPDEAKVKALCDGLKAAQQAKGDMALDVADWEEVKAAAAEAFAGGDAPGPDMDPGMDDEAEFEDKAVGDGEPAGPEGGEEHEGKTKMMDGKGRKPHDLDGDGDEDSDDWKTARDRKIQGSMKRRRPRKSDQMEGKGGTSGTPIGTGNTSGSGGGGQKDLSKAKAYHGKPVGTGTSGAGGSNANEYGQKPHPDGGSNNVPEYEEGNQLGADSTVFDGDAEKPAPRRQKPLAAESKKNSKKKLDEAILLGMSGIPGTIRDEVDGPSDADWDDEMKTIKRRAGMDDWWK